ncbi:Acyl-transf-3 domain-containing protein [Aphelenchoides besseyi]|nr:Acyl-transf-3 domain-containing protein [Aphelenchoides besseyi]
MTVKTVQETTKVHRPTVIEIQGLRGVAIMAVLLFHLWDKTFEVGYLGVDIFFVISGYLMCMLLSRHPNLTVNKIGDFYYRRVKRIVPIYLFVIWLILMAAVFRFIYPIDYSTLFGETVKPLMFIANIPDSTADDYFIQSMGSYSFEKHLWSLSVEIQFYVFVPGLIWLLSWVSIPIKSLIVALIAIASYWKQSYSEANDEHMSLGSRVWQILFVRNLTPWCSKLFQIVLTAILIAGVTINLTGDKQQNRLILLAATSLLIARPYGNLLLSCNALVWLGNISYSVYLVHWPIFELQKYLDVKMYTFGKTTTLTAVGLNLGIGFFCVVALSYVVILITCFYLIETAVPQTKGRGDKNIVVLGNSHARSYYFGLEYAFRGVYKTMAMVGTNCPLVAMDLEKRGGSGYGYERCTQFRKNVFKMLRNWNERIDIIIVGTNYHRYINFNLNENLKRDRALHDLNYFYGSLAKLAKEVLFMPGVQFNSGLGIHTPTLQRKILYGNEKDLSVFRAPLAVELSHLSLAQKRLQLVKCGNCIKINWFDLYCDYDTSTCDSIDFKTKFSYFFDSHHVNAYGSLKAGEYMRKLYDEWKQKNTLIVGNQTVSDVHRCNKEISKLNI